MGLNARTLRAARQRGRVPVAALVAVLAVVVIGAGLWLSGLFDPSPDSGGGARPAPAPAETAKRPATAESAPALTPTSIESTPYSKNNANDPGEAQLRGNDTRLGVQGLVVGPNQAPVANAEVALIADASPIRSQPKEGEVLARVRSRADGSFAFGRLRPGQIYIVRAAHADFAPERVHPIDPADPNSLSPTIRLSEGTSVSGRVTDEGGAPVADAEVSATDHAALGDENAVPERIVRTAADGSYKLGHLRPGLKRMLARKSPFATDGVHQADLRPGTPLQNVDFVLVRGQSIRGIVLDKTTMQPIAGARIGATPIGPLAAKGDVVSEAPPAVRGQADAVEADESSQGQVRTPDPSAMRVMQRLFVSESAVSDAEGRFEIGGLQPARYQLAVSARGFEKMPGVLAEAGQSDVRVEMMRGARVAGVVVDRDTGTAVTSFSIALIQEPDPLSVPNGARQFFDDPQGRFEYLDARPGQHYVLAEAEGYAGGRTEIVQVTPGQQVADIVVAVVRGATLRGSVRRTDASPVAGARVRLVAERASASDPGQIFVEFLKSQTAGPATKVATTEADGSWSMPNVLAGRFKVTVSHPDFCEAESLAVSVPDQGEVDAGTVTLLVGATVRGRVRTTAGEPDAQAAISISPADLGMGLPQAKTVSTGADGRFEIKGLKPGRHRIFVAQREGKPDILAMIRQQQDPAAILVLGDGEVRELDL